MRFDIAKYSMSNYICQKCNNPFDAIIKHGYVPKNCSRSCANSRIRTEETKNKISSTLKDIGRITKILFCECEICKVPYTWNALHRGYKKCCTNPICIKQYRYNVRQGKVGGFHPNSTRVHRSVYNRQQMDSGAELAFAKLLDKNNIQWIKNSTIFFEYLPEKKYYPDFYLPKYNTWIEIKGKKYIRKDDELRWLSVPDLEVIWSTDIKLPSCVAPPRGNDPLLQP